jgi:5-bromo-4-chloroindolyl phosphate hydrolysis protein
MRAVKVGGIVRRGRAWAPTAKSAVLFLAPLPLAAATLAALINDDLSQALLAGGALTCIWAAGALAFQGLAAEARYSLNEQETLPRLRLKLLSALLTGAGVGLAAVAGGSPISVVLIFVLLAIAGHVAFFGTDRRPRRIRVADAEGIDRVEVEELLVQASRRLRGLEIAAESIAVPDVRRRLAAVLSTGNAILQELERRPSEASRARRFLNVYLDGAERVTSEYARAAASPGRSAPDREYQVLLGDLERAFTAQHRRLVERDRVALDVDIEVLTARLRQELPASGENRS